MFKRLILGDSAALFTLAAFITAASIFLSIAWRAIRMGRAQTEKFENLPFETATPAAQADRSERRSFNVGPALAQGLRSGPPQAATLRETAT